MLVETGIIVLFLSLIASIVGVGLALISIFAHRPVLLNSARNALFLTLPLLLVVSGILIYAQLEGHYEIDFVRSVSSDAQPTALKVTALWGGQAGSLILWSLLLSLFTVAALILNWRSEQRLMPWTIVVAGVTLGFFLLLNNVYENPFARTWALENGNITTAVLQPDGAVLAYPYQSDFEGEQWFTNKEANVPGARYDGHGLNPLLRHPGMIIHPPMLYLGFTGFMIPFAFAMAALFSGDFSANWIRATRRWSLVAWMFLSLGLILGGRWAYDVLGWGGYWGWDPVENSSFLPWLTGTAFLHSVQIQEKRGMLKGWNMVMIILTYLLVLFGTVATRTGLLSSVHSFAQSPLSVPMALFLGFSIIAAIALFLWRGSQGAFENDHALEGMLSRESLFLFNNWVFLALTVVVFWGTWSELITGMMRDAGLLASTITLGREYYEMIVPWLFLILYILMGIAPLAAWRRASASKLGGSLRIPTVLAVVVFLVLATMGKDPIIDLGFAIVAFAGFATLLEFYKGVAARHRAHHEQWHLATLRLLARNRRRYGGYIIHLGIVIIGIGIIASTAFQEVKQETLNPGETLQLGGNYSLRYNNVIEATAVDDRGMIIANTTLLRNGKEVADLRPRRDFFGSNASPMTIAGLHSTLENDVYVLLTFWEDDQVTFRVYRNPLINFVWGGGILLILGTLIAVFPNPEPQTITRKDYRYAMAAAGD